MKIGLKMGLLLSAGVFAGVHATHWWQARLARETENVGQDQRASLASIEARHRALLEKHRGAETALRDASNRIARLDTELAAELDVNNPLREKVVEINAARMRLESANVAQSEALDALRGELERWRIEAGEQKQRAAARESELAGLRDEHSAVGERLAQAVAQLETLRGEQASAEERFRQSAAEIETLTDRILSADEALAAAEKNRAAGHEALQEAQSRVTELETEVNRLKAEIGALRVD